MTNALVDDWTIDDLTYYGRRALTVPSVSLPMRFQIRAVNCASRTRRPAWRIASRGAAAGGVRRGVASVGRGASDQAERSAPL